MASQRQPERKLPLHVSVDANVRAELLRRKREEALNVSQYVNHLLKQKLFFKPSCAPVKR